MTADRRRSTSARRLLAAGALFPALAVAGCGGDAEEYESIQLAVTPTEIQAETIDGGDGGASQGDVRPFSATLVDAESGEEVGRLDGDQVITAVEEGDETTVEYRFGTLQFTLDGGTIVASGIYVAEPDAAVPAEPGTRAIVGGTGDYVGARGEVRTVAEGDENRIELDFELPAGLADRIPSN